MTGTASAAESCDSRQLFNIPSQSLNQALLNFARQAELSVLIPGDTYRGITANRVQGYFCPQQALDFMMLGLGLDARIVDSGQVVIEARQGQAPEESGVSGAVVENATEDAADSGVESFRPREIMITGSRLQRLGMETPTPVTAVNAREINLLSPDNLIEAVSLLPQFLNNSSPATVGSVSGPRGSSFLNLRGLGSNRTLVLLNGRRMAPSNHLGVPDIATFPEAMIGSMEIVTGGASAVYGSDAVSGVVNFRLDTGYTGVTGNVQGGVSSRDDNGKNAWSLAAGTPVGERNHVLFSMDYFQADKVESYADRNWFRNWGTVDVGGTGEPYVVAPDVRSRLYTAGGLIRLPGSQLDMLHFLEGGQSASFVDGSLVGETRQVGGTGYYGDIASKEEDQTGQGSLYPRTERGNMFFHLEHKFNQEWRSWLQLIYGKSEIDYRSHGAHQEAPWEATIYADNAFLPDDIRQIMTQENLGEFPLYRYSSQRDMARARGMQDNRTVSYTLGLDGELDDTRISTFYQFSRNSSIYTVRDFPRLDRLYKAIDVVADPVTGRPVCRSSLSFPDDGCVPANPFGAGTMSEEAVDYVLDGDMYRDTELRQHVFELNLSQDIFQQRQAGPLSLAAGASWRKESMYQYSGPDEMVALSVLPAEEEGYRGLPERFVRDQVLQFAGIDDEPLSGSFDVWEVFGEMQLPLLRDIPGIQALDANAAYRYADYSGSGGVNAWKLGLDWRLNEELRFRATRSRDTRAATLAERFDLSSAGFTAYDPILDESYTISMWLGGNPEVAPELADTWTAGLVYQPRFWPGFSMSVDWYDVKVKDYIDLLGAQTIIDNCAAGELALCEYVTRNSASNQIERVDNLYFNVTEARAKGIDMEFSWQSPVSLFRSSGENLELRLFASYLMENSLKREGEARRDAAGTTSLPDWTATAMLSYYLGNFSSSLSGRYISQRVQYNEALAPSENLSDNSVDSVYYLNLRLQYELSRLGGSDYTFYFDVANLMDEDPPVVASFSQFSGASAFPPGLHDTIGRYYTLGVNFDF